jgi:hypothetical protein
MLFAVLDASMIITGTLSAYDMSQPLFFFAHVDRNGQLTRGYFSPHEVPYPLFDIEAGAIAKSTTPSITAGWVFTVLLMGLFDVET